MSVSPDHARLGRVAIVGAGQVGTMLGLALRPSGAARGIRLFDRDPSVVERSLARGAGDGAARTAAEALEADTLVLAVPVGAIVGFLREHGGAIRDGTLVVDTGSAKQVVVEAMLRLPAAVHAIGGHPLAGTEVAGPAGADASALRGATFALCPVRDDPQALERAKRLIEAVGAQALVLDAAAHDRIVARTSHLPHLLAFALARAAGPLAGDASAFAAGGFRGVARLAKSDPEMVAAFLAANAAEAHAALGELRRALDELESHLDDEAALARVLAKAAR
jgi:prephenate dehydrogenase